MSSSASTNIPIPPRNLQDDSALEIGTPSPSSQQLPYLPPGVRSQDIPGRVSFSQPALRRPSGIPLTRTFTGGTTGGRSVRDAEALLSPVSERPPIPSALTGGGSHGLYATPLPKLPLIVLSIVSHISSSLEHALNASDRPCSESSYRQMSAPPFYSLWWKVCMASSITISHYSTGGM